MISLHPTLGTLVLLGALLLASGCQKPTCTPRLAPEGTAVTEAKSEPPKPLGPPPRSTAFLNPDLPDERRLDVLLSELTRDEKVACLGTRPDVPRLGIHASDHVEGLHGLALGGPGRWGGSEPVTTTSFPQSIGLGQTWNVELLRRVAAAESAEARYAFHVKERGGLVIRAPDADLGRDPRWGRNEECYGEDAS
ncbi:MAG: glycoside hydrolase family 3 N-terminal domain-containing protein [Polyangiaceae bacterium]